MATALAYNYINFACVPYDGVFMKKILVIGSVGQIGSELTPRLREKYGNENVVAAGHRTQPSEGLKNAGPFVFIDATKK